MKRQEWDHSKIQGVDVNIETSLKEYGLAWIEGDTGILFYYGIKFGGNEYIRFGFSIIEKNLDIYSEYDWVGWEDIKDYSDTFEAGTLPQKIKTLVSYYGYENIFGETYWGNCEGLTYEKVIKGE